MTDWERTMLTVVFIYVVCKMLTGTLALALEIWGLLS
jgi:hypothetical protein